MIPRPIGLGARLAALHAASFGGIGIYVPFFPIWLESRGLPASWIGIVLALPIVVRVLVTAPLMTLADRSMGARRLVAAACLGVSVIYLTLLAARDPVVVAVLVIFMAVAQAPIIPAADLVTIQAIRREPRLDYGRLRLWGSIAFLIASIGGGYLLEVLPADAVIWFLFSLAICAMATAWAVVHPLARSRLLERDHRAPLGDRRCRRNPGLRLSRARRWTRLRCGRVDPGRRRRRYLPVCRACRRPRTCHDLRAAGP